jgi:hypothetical protein
LPEIIKGERKTTTFEEGMQVGKVCRVKQHYTAALRLYERLLANEPDAAKKLAPTNYVIMARVALNASAGIGKDPPPEADRPKYRAKALAWLRLVVRVEREALEKDFIANHYTCQATMRALLLHKDLATVRPPALNGLPAEVRKEWEDLWDEVETLLEKADGPSPEPSAVQKP